MLRADLVEQMQAEEYIMMARAKGAGPWRILLRHALRNSTLGLITLIGLNLGTLVVVSNLLAGLAYTALDPRIRYGRAL